MSFTTTQAFYADIFGIKVSTGFLAKQIGKASKALEGTYDALVSQLRKEKHLHSDETGGSLRQQIADGRRQQIFLQTAVCRLILLGSFDSRGEVSFREQGDEGCSVWHSIVGCDRRDV
jgi:hypothetical protein